MKHPKRSPGFSLILSLTVMAGLVLLTVTISAFITVESRMAMNQHLATRARLNAIVSMRLALAHLQQEAGPDQRATARADITQPDATASSIRNPMWTGVWRTDLPDLPPAWLVSGRDDQPAGAQSVSLHQSINNPDYPEGYWAPWMAGSAPAQRDEVPLVGLGSALPEQGNLPSGLVVLPKIALPDDETNGSYAYWIGDEGIKARINLADDRSKKAGDADQLIAIRSPVTQGMLKNLPDQTQLTKLGTIAELPLLGGISNALPGAGNFEKRAYFHDVSMTSAGVIADSRNGGLKRDLSQAFELSDSEFAKTEFGEGRFLDDNNTPDGAAGTHVGTGFAGRKARRNTDDPLMMPIVTGPNSQSGSANGNLVAAPIYSRETPSGALRGPTWWALRDYHRLYKQIGWSAGGVGRGTTTPTFRARTFWPNVAKARPTGNPDDIGLPNNSIRNRVFGYSDIYNGDLPDSLNPNASDVLGGDRGRLVTRPLHVAATPYVQRMSLVFSLSRSVAKQGNTTRNYLYLNITPVVVLHNPYNVRMVWQSSKSTNSAAYPAVVTISDLASWNLKLKGSKPVTGASSEFSYPITLSSSAKKQDSANTETLNVYLRGSEADATITMDPGEMRVFSCEPISGSQATIAAWTPNFSLSNQFTIGRAIEVGDIVEKAYDIIDENKAFRAEIVPGTTISLRHGLDCWPGDEIRLGSVNNGYGSLHESLIRTSSEQTELVINRYDPPGASADRGRDFLRGVSDIPYKYKDEKFTSNGPNNVTAVFAILDVSLKTADATHAPFPTFTHSNPLAASLRASAAGRPRPGDPLDPTKEKGATGAPPSYQLTIRGVTAWEDVIQQPSNQTAYGGHAVSAAKGAERVILTEIPLTQPTSLAQYAHANFGVSDQHPLLAIGNSFASPYVQATKSFQNNGSNWTGYDQSYLLNAALWDGFFLSSLAPQMQTTDTSPLIPNHPEYTAPSGNGSVNSSDQTTIGIEKKTLTQTVEELATNGGRLDNPRYVIDSAGMPGDLLATSLKDFRRSAGVMLNLGAFNVNSTSVQAWKHFLGSAKKTAVGKLAETSPAADQNTRFPRALAKDLATAAVGNSTNPSNWSGLANLSDQQIAWLAEAVVAENKARFQIQTRTESDSAISTTTRVFKGLDKPATPYLGLAEFVNRFLCPETWASRCGTLQSAILRADNENNAALSARLKYGASEIAVSAQSLASPTAGWFPHPDNVEVAARGASSQTHSAFAAPGNLLQSDLLQVLGSALATRSDTFTLRCFGQATEPTGDMAQAWLEVTVQRTPRFIDEINPPETGSAAPKPLTVGAPTSIDPTVSSTLTAINHLLGRRFKIISSRWLKPDEI